MVKHAIDTSWEQVKNQVKALWGGLADSDHNVMEHEWRLQAFGRRVRDDVSTEASRSAPVEVAESLDVQSQTTSSRSR